MMSGVAPDAHRSTCHPVVAVRSSAARGKNDDRRGDHVTTIEHPDTEQLWYDLTPAAAADELHVDAAQGLDAGEVARRLAEVGPNALRADPPPSRRALALAQGKNPMNVMLLVVGLASFTIGQFATGIFVLGLVTFNVVMGTNQELKAQASVDALAKLQVPRARVRRGGQIEEIDSTGIVPGDVVLVEAGDIVPADGRILPAATLEVQEAALTGESAPVPKDAVALPSGEVALGDRTDLVFQNTQVT